MDLLVVGAGRMGRWFAHATRDAVEGVAFADADPAVAESAADAVGGRTVPVEADGTPTGPETFDVVCVAVPIPAVESAVAAHADRAERALVDVTGVAGPPVDAMAEHAPDRERASLHPLFAPERAPGNVAVVPSNPGPVTDHLVAALSARGNDPFETTAAEHDEAMASVQGAAHAAVLAYALAAGDVREEFHTPVSSGLADLAATVTDGDPGLYADVQAAFGGAEAVAQAAGRIADADGDAFADLFEAAGRSDATAGESER